MNEEITVLAEVSMWNRVRDFIIRCIGKVGNINKNIESKICIACEEIYVNISNYAYEDKKGTVSIKFEYNEKKSELSVTFSDSGKKFNPTNESDPRKHKPLHNRKPGGLGIYMIKKLMDKVEYEYTAKHNILTIVKNINNDGGELDATRNGSGHNISRR